MSKTMIYELLLIDRPTRRQFKNLSSFIDDDNLKIITQKVSEAIQNQGASKIVLSRFTRISSTEKSLPAGKVNKHSPPPDGTPELEKPNANNNRPSSDHNDHAGKKPARQKPEASLRNANRNRINQPPRRGRNCRR